MKKEAATWATVALLILSVPVAVFLYYSSGLWVWALLPALIFVSAAVALRLSARSRD